MRPVNTILGAAALCGALLVGGAGWTAESKKSEPYAHQLLTLQGAKIWLQGDGENQPLADVTAFCVECHGGAAPGGESHLIGPEESSHPTGIAYPAEHSEYRAIEELDPGVLLTGGRVTCLSCHAYDSPDHQTVLPVEGGHLCQACHLL